MNHSEQYIAKQDLKALSYTQMVRDAMRRAGEPVSVFILGGLSGLHYKIVRDVVDRLLRNGEIISLHGKRATRYGFPKEREKKKGSGQIAERITIPQYRWGSTRMG